MSINDYTLKIKGIVEPLASINVFVDDDNLVSVCLNGLGKEYKPFKISIIVKENVPNFQDLMSMLIIEEKTLGEDSSTQSKNTSEQAFYSNSGRGREEEVLVEAKVVANLEIKSMGSNNQMTHIIMDSNNQDIYYS